jgi:hypothetical protein
MAISAAEARQQGYTRKRFRGLDQPPHYVSPTLSYVYGRDYSLCTNREVSLLTLSGRIHVVYQGYDKHVALLEQGAHLGGAKLWYDRSKKQFYLLVAFEIDMTDPVPLQAYQLIGVDVGQRYLATVATTEGSTKFYSGKEICQQADRSQLPSRDHRHRRLDPYPRQDLAQKTPTKRQESGASVCQGQESQSACEPVGLCRAAGMPDLQSAAFGQCLYQGRCGLYQSGLPPVRVHQQDESEK